MDKETEEAVIEMVDDLNLKENGESIGCALSIKTVSVNKFENGCGKETAFAELDETIGNKNVKNQEREEEREKRPRRRRNSRKNSEAQNSCKESGCYFVIETQNGVKNYGDEAKRIYSREEMESLRFLDLEAQKKEWLEAYCGLAPDIVKEYDNLGNCNQKRQNQLDFDPRKQFQNAERSRGAHGEDCFQVIDDENENVKLSNPDLEFSEEDDSDDDCNSMLRPAFYVSGEPKFDSGPPQDGFEYLRRVRWEAERIPKVKIAKLEKSKLIKEQTVYMPNIPDIAKCPDHLLPTKEWEDAFLADFSELRLAFSRIDGSTASSSSILKLPSPIDEEDSNTELPRSLAEKINNILSDEDEVESYIDQESSPNSDENKNNTRVNGSSKESPTLSLILKMDSITRLLTLRRRINSVINMTSLYKKDCEWLFALCVAIDTPLNGDMCASLRSLLRKTASLRAEKTIIDDEFIMLSIIGAITGKYFGQSG